MRHSCVSYQIMTSIETRTTTIGGVTLTGEGYLSGDGGSFTPGSSFASAISSVTATMHPSTTGSSSPPSSAWTGPMTTSVPTGSGAGATNHPPVSTDAAAASRGESESDRQASTAVTSAGQLTTITVAPTSTTTRQLLVMGGTTYVEPGLYSLQLSMYSVLSGNSEDVAYYTQHNQPFDSANPPWATFITTTLLHTAASSGPTGSSGSSEPDTTFPAMAVYGASKTVMSGTTFYPYDEFQSLVASAWVSGSSAALASFTEANGVVVPSSSTLSTDPVQTTSGGNVAETGSAESEHAPSESSLPKAPYAPTFQASSPVVS